MLRGSQTITSIFQETPSPAKKMAGAFTMDRDVALAYRFYYHYNIARKRFDDAIAQLAGEFYISQTTVVKRLTENDLLLKDISQNAPTSKQLAKRYPHWVW